jgi:hypothetical protein
MPVKTISPFRDWAAQHSAHLNNVVFALSPDAQLLHERHCEICREGLRIAFASMTAEQVVNAVEQGVLAAEALAERRESKARAAAASEGK